MGWGEKGIYLRNILKKLGHWDVVTLQKSYCLVNGKSFTKALINLKKKRKKKTKAEIWVEVKREYIWEMTSRKPKVKGKVIYTLWAVKNAINRAENSMFLQVFMNLYYFAISRCTLSLSFEITTHPQVSFP